METKYDGRVVAPSQAWSRLVLEVLFESSMLAFLAASQTGKGFGVLKVTVEIGYGILDGVERDQASTNTLQKTSDRCVTT